MRRGKRSAEDRAGERLLERWQRRPEYGDPIGCIATTYTFDAAHFEEHCLARFVGMESDPAEDARSYLIEREERLSQVFAGVLVDQAHVSAKRSLRWNLLPVRVEQGGCLHAKVTLLAWQHRVRVIVASANLSVPAYRSNLENAAIFDFTPEGESPRSILTDVIALLDDIRSRAPGHGQGEGPQVALDRFLRGVTELTSSWKSPAHLRGEPSAALVVIGPGRQPLFTQLANQWSWGPAEDAWVVSPFFDEGDGALVTLAGLETLLKQRGERTVHLITSGVRLPDDTVQLDLPACLRPAGRERVERRFYLVRSESSDGHRSLHAKSLWLQREDRALFCVGSSNFTRAGTGQREHGPVNIEANVVYVLPESRDDFGKVCAQAYPDYDELDLDEEEVQFVAAGQVSADPEGHAPLPAQFGSALYRIRDGLGELELELLSPPPPDVSIASEHGPIALPEGEATYPRRVSSPWHELRPPSHLVVRWTGSSGELSAIWPVNVADTNMLPPPEELRALTLDELVEVLMSARPVHDAVGRILKRREERGAGAALEVDPHRKVDTRHFLLKRMRRMAAAFEELRARLERPMYTRDALAWRLRGPLGPLVLARRMVEEEPTSAAFQLAELALSLRGLRLQPHGELSLDEMQAAVAEVLAELQAMATAHPAPPNLAVYVARTFAEGSS